MLPAVEKTRAHDAGVVTPLGQQNATSERVDYGGFLYSHHISTSRDDELSLQGPSTAPTPAPFAAPSSLP